jgi:iron complex outermembrane receptor protein
MRTAVAAAVACLSIASITLAADVQASIRRPVNIPAQGLGPALQALAKERGVHFVFVSEDVENQRTSGAVGNLGLDEALQTLLGGTGLTYQYIDESTVSILPIAAVPTTSLSPQDRAAGSQATVLGVAAGEGDVWSRFRMAQNEGGSSTPASVSANAAARGHGEDLEEIVVTAQKREERLQDVPISLSVLEGSALDHGSFAGVAEAVNQVGGVNLFKDNQGGGVKVSVRGVASGGPLFFGASTVGYYLDEAAFGFVKTAIVPDANAYDIERVEVLRGPQGTLYGASALNGVVRVLTKDADLDAFDFKARTSFSSTEGGGENYRGDLAVNVPLVPGKLAARAVVGYSDYSGWIDNTFAEETNDAELATFRLKINAQPTDALNVTLSAWSSRSDYGAPSAATEDGLSTVIFEEPLAADYDLYGLTINYDFPAFAVTSATSYLDYSSEGELDFLNVQPLFTGLYARTFAQEIRLHSTGKGPWRWSFGGIYRDSEDDLVQTLSAFLPAPIDFSDLSESFAVFGELSRRFLNDELELTLGLRHFSDDVTNRENIRHTGNPAEPLYSAKSEFDATTPRAILTWYPSGELTLYGSYSEGFRSGFNQNANVITAAPQFPPVKEDRLKNYEIGAKGTLVDGRLFFDTALYYIDWQDVQQTVGVQVAPGTVVTALVNGESASGLGVDVGLTLKPTDSLQLRLALGWNDLTLDHAVTSDELLAGDVLFEEGERLNESAETTAGLAADYLFPLGSSGFEGQISCSAHYHTELVSRSAVPGAVVFGRGDDVLNTRLDFTVRSAQHWTATIFADNLTNEDNIVRAGPFGFLLFGLSTERPRPRPIGVQFEYDFGQ